MATLRTSVSSDKENDIEVVTQDKKLSKIDDKNHQLGCIVDSVNA